MSMCRVSAELNGRWNYFQMNQGASPGQAIKGDSEDTVRIQIYVAIIAYCLIAIIDTTSRLQVSVRGHMYP